MTSGPYTRNSMDAARTEHDPGDAREEREAPSTAELGDGADLPDDRGTRDPIDARIDGLVAEANEAIAYSANVLRSVRERYRTAYGEALGRWQALSDEVDELERRLPPPRPRLVVADNETREPPGAPQAPEGGAED